MDPLLVPYVLWRDCTAYGRYIKLNAIAFGATFVVGMVLVTNRAYLPILRLLFPAGERGAGDVALTTVDLALHNGLIAVVMLAGAATLGLLTIGIVVYNGLAIGAASLLAVVQLGPTGGFALLAPHGVLELPAILLAGSVGTGLPWRLAEGERRQELVRGLRLATVVLAALLAAAWIEANVTGTIAETVEWR